jgi:phosphatidylglycerophosphate synthase
MMTGWLVNPFQFLSFLAEDGRKKICGGLKKSHMTTSETTSDMSNYNKLPRQLDNPIDYAFYDLSDRLSPIFKRMHFTPNQITTLSFIAGLLAVMLFRQCHRSLFYWGAGVVCLWISYFFDCMDGIYARRYKMATAFGDVYDHAKDVIVVILMIVLLILHYTLSSVERIILVFIVVGGIILTECHVGCQQTYHTLVTGRKSEGVLQMHVNLCPAGTRAHVIKNLGITRWGGCGFVYVTLTVAFLYVGIKRFWK